MDRIRSKVIRDKLGVTPIKKPMREARVKWFGNTIGRDVNAFVQRCERIDLPLCKRGRGRTKKS